MSSKFLALLVSLYVASTLTPSLAASDAQLKKQIAHFQTQITQSKTQKKQIQKPLLCIHGYQKHDDKHMYRDNTSYYFCCLETGPYVSIQEAFDGSELVINIPTTREDAQLLLRQHQLKQKCHEVRISIPPLPRVILSGKLEGQLTCHKNAYRGKGESRPFNINFSSAGLGAYIQGNSWISGYMTLDYDPDESTNKSNLFMNRAFITVGNLSRLPFYSSIGQVYIPFGRYSSSMVSSTVTLGLGRTRARALSIGYQKTGNNALHAEVYDYQEPTKLFCGNQNNQWGADVGYAFNNGSHIGGEVEVSFISNLADSQGIQDKAFLYNGAFLHHIVQGVDVYASLDMDSIVFRAEYVGALRAFDVTDFVFNNQGARPTAFHIETSYAFHTDLKPSSIGFGYGHTTQSLVLGLPQNRYSVFYNINIWRNTNFSLEYRHDINYSYNAIGTGTGVNLIPSDIITGLGKRNNAVTVQFDLYF